MDKVRDKLTPLSEPPTRSNMRTWTANAMPLSKRLFLDTSSCCWEEKQPQGVDCSSGAKSIFEEYLINSRRSQWAQTSHNQKAWIQVLWHFFLKSLSIVTYPVTVKVLSHPKGWVIGKEPPTALYISWMISNKYCLALLNTGLDSTSLDISISRGKRWLSKEDCQFFSKFEQFEISSTHLNRVKQQSEMALAVHLCTSQKWLLQSNFGKVCQRTVLCA